MDRLPHKTRPSALGVYCPSPVVSAYLCTGDTVQIADESCPSFVGHIIDVPSTISLKAAIHPDALSHPPFLLVQHFISTEECDTEDWPLLDNETAESSFGMDEVAESNRTIWISPHQVK